MDDTNHVVIDVDTIDSDQRYFGRNQMMKHSMWKTSPFFTLISQKNEFT